MANHGTVFASRHKLARERVEAMKEIWTKSKAEYHGVRKLRSDDDLAEAGPETASANHRRRRLPVRRAARFALRRRLDAPARAANMRTCTPCCQNSARWQPRRDAIPRRYRSRSAAPKRTSTCSSVTATKAFPNSSSAWIPARPIRPAGTRPLGDVDPPARQLNLDERQDLGPELHHAFEHFGGSRTAETEIEAADAHVAHRPDIGGD